MASLLHPFTNLTRLRQNGPTVITRGSGVFVYGADGKDYLEAMGGLWCTALGWGEEELVEAAAQQMRKLSFQHIFGGKSHEPAIELAEALKELAPFPVGKVFFANSGSEANDSQIKFMWYAANARGHTARKKIIARDRAYHGVTLASASLTGLDAFHKSFNLPFDFTVRAECPHYYHGARDGESQEAYSARLAGELEATIQKEGPDTIAAMFAEAVMGAGGAIVPPRGYFEAIAKVLSRYDIPLVDDEVICGFGRLGAWFSSEMMGAKPDLITFAKGVTSGYIPLGGVVVGKRVADVLIEKGGEFNHGYTYSGHPVACAVALANLDIIEREGLVERVHDLTGPYLAEQFAGLADHPLVAAPETLGMVGGFVLMKDKTKNLAFDASLEVGMICRDHCFANGLIMRAVGDRMIIAPPLVCTKSDIDEMMKRVRICLDATLKDIQSRGWMDAAHSAEVTA